MITKKQVEIYGHRGARGHYPENTIAGFLEAVKMGVNGVEMDVVISKDHRVVVSHEPWMNDLFCSQPDGQPIAKNSADRFNIYQMTYDEVCQYDCGLRGNPGFPQQQKMAAVKPLLSEVMDALENFTSKNGLPAITFNIEIKSEPGYDQRFQPQPEEFVFHVFEILKTFRDCQRIYISSFDPGILNVIKKKHPGMTLGLLVENRLPLSRNLDDLGFLPDIYSPGFELIDQELVDALHLQNIKLITWTVNDPADMTRLIKMGVDGIITDYPDRLVELVKKIEPTN